MVDNVIDANRARAVLDGLEEAGLIAPASRVEQLAQERLAALKAEHGLKV